MPTDPARARWPAVLSAVLAVAVYAVSLGGTYVYDDARIIRDDPRIHTPAQWGQFWTRAYNQSIDNLYRPLTSTSYAVQWWLHGDRPRLFHLVNILLHGAVAACVAEFARRLMGWNAALIAGVLFAVHPIHVEAVANIVGRAELLCALGMFGALLLVTFPPSARRFAGIIGCFSLSVLSKEQGMLVSPLVLIFILLRPGRVGKQDSILIVTLCICLAAYVAVREHFLPFEWDRSLLDWTINPMAPGPDHPHGGSVSADAWLMPIALLGRYAALLIAPVRLSLDYGGRIIGWHVSPGDPYLYVGIVAILSWCILFLVALRRRWYAGAFVAIGLALTYAMVSNFLVLIGTNFAERLAYIPSAFLLILVGAGAARLPGKTPIVLVTAVVGLFSLRTITYEIRWNDTLPFYATSLAEQPESIRLRILLADEYRRRGDFASAERVVSEAREKLPEYWDVWLQSAQIAMDQGKFDEAEAYLSRASRISRPRADLWSQELARRRMAATRQN